MLGTSSTHRLRRDMPALNSKEEGPEAENCQRSREKLQVTLEVSTIPGHAMCLSGEYAWEGYKIICQKLLFSSKTHRPPPLCPLAFHHCNERLQGSAFEKGKVLFWLEVLKFFAHDRGAYGRRVDHPEDMWQRELHLRLGTKERGGECLPQSTQGGAIPKDLRPPIRPHLLKSTPPLNSTKLRTKLLTCRSLDDVPDYSNNQNSLHDYLSGQLSPALHHQ